MNIDAIVARACERVPDLLRGALMLVPDGFLLGAAGAGGALDLEPLVRSAVRCLGAREGSIFDGDGDPCVEYLLVIQDQTVAIQRGRRDPRLGLAVVAGGMPNPAFVLGAARLALADIEEVVDLTRWGL